MVYRYIVFVILFFGGLSSIANNNIKVKANKTSDSLDKKISTEDYLKTHPIILDKSTNNNSSNFISNEKNKDFGESKYDKNTPISIIESGDYKKLREQQQSDEIKKK